MSKLTKRCVNFVTKLKYKIVDKYCANYRISFIINLDKDSYMSHFYERMLFKEVHFSNEIIKLDKLLKEESHYFWETNTSETLYSYINKRHFRHLNLSYNFLSLSEYFRDALAEAEDDKEKYLFYCEAITTLIHQLIESNRRLDGHDLDWVNGQIKSIRRIISTNIGKLNLIEKEVKTECLHLAS